MTVDLVVVNCTVVTPAGRTPDAGVAVDDGTIVAVGRSDRLPDADRVVDADGKVLVPGIVDCHIHNREPGLEYKEDWETATHAAAAGGVTTVVGMPNTDPVIDRPEHLELKFERGETSAHVDFQSYAVVTSENLELIPDIDEVGPLGFKIFLGSTVGDVPPPTDGEILEAMERIRETGTRLGFHEENGEIIDYYTEQFQQDGRDEPIDHSHSRPVIAEQEAVERMISFADETGAKIHMFHVSSGSAAEAVARGKEQGVDVTAETCPHYLWFTEDVMREKGNPARIQPPIRDADEQERLWAVGIDDGAIDHIATDHAPHTPAEKKVDDPFGNTWDATSGFVGLETEIPVMLSFVNEGRLTLEEWVRYHSTRPAQVWGMYPQKGSLQVGTDADFTIVDPEREWTLEDSSELHSKNCVTPFVGESFTGKASTTVVRGEIVYEDGAVVGESGYGTRVDPADS
ncbi:allantoinase AllB [Natronobacterium gregoryi]|uniref:Dihydroorotase n=2 Tax=Natronobacterium gregoryi TaxID=44930 RepID=L0AM75_NATGS|nr:allantoinase AllB [Natronobacterium gregoryi]AFZ74130.1 allantoinase [Natronobacterium gregoryi SP2]ELY63867.1 dihydroorotase, multifunctional complex type [Natronobacterium gregoryi SP2]PLK22075.1 allantoinase AllB [Natronobacterium gregoryi SP2]SFI50013.1 dihydroorotase/allantoinase [Natronobacterium gregoryi]